MKNNNKFRLDVWGFITLAMIALYLVFMIYPMGYLIRQSVWDAETGAFTWANFAKFFSKSYYIKQCKFFSKNHTYKCKYNHRKYNYL